MEKLDEIYEQFKVHGRDLAGKVGELIHEGNVRRIIVKDEQGHTFMEIPLTVAAVGVVAAPLIAALGAIATVVARFEIVVERSSPRAPQEDAPAASAPPDESDELIIGADPGTGKSGPQGA
jgi:hypothetical protein